MPVELAFIQRIIRRMGRKLAAQDPPRQPQLVMWYPHAEPPDPGILPEGYRLRAFHPGDEDGWAALLNANGQLGQWDLERIRREIGGASVLHGQRFVLCGDEIVATAGVYDRQREGKDAWEIGWIASHPDHRGRNLGGQVTAGALAVALQLPRRPIYLLTDDFRLPALKVYLKLGFVPDMQHPSYAERWQAILGQLGESYAHYRSLLPPFQQGRIES